MDPFIDIDRYFIIMYEGRSVIYICVNEMAMYKPTIRTTDRWTCANKKPQLLTFLKFQPVFLVRNPV